MLNLFFVFSQKNKKNFKVTNMGTDSERSEAAEGSQARVERPKAARLTAFGNWDVRNEQKFLTLIGAISILRNTRGVSEKQIFILLKYYRGGWGTKNFKKVLLNMTTCSYPNI